MSGDLLDGKILHADSANSQFFICFDTADFLDGDYTVWGQVISGMEHVDKIKRGIRKRFGNRSRLHEQSVPGETQRD